MERPEVEIQKIGAELQRTVAELEQLRNNTSESINGLLVSLDDAFNAGIKQMGEVGAVLVEMSKKENTTDYTRLDYRPKFEDKPTGEP